MIHKCENDENASTLRISSKLEHIKAVKTEDINSLDDLIPGMEVEFLVDKVHYI